MVYVLCGLGEGLKQYYQVFCGNTEFWIHICKPFKGYILQILGIESVCKLSLNSIFLLICMHQRSFKEIA